MDDEDFDYEDFDDNEDENDDDDSAFIEPEKKEETEDFEPSFTVIDPDDLLKTQFQETEKLENVLKIPKSSAFALLQFYHWKQDRLIDSYVEDPDRVLSKAGIALETKDEGVKISNNFLCPICYCESDKTETFGISCNHRYCVSCYKTYINTKIITDQQPRIQCIGCKLIIGQSHILKIIDGDTHRRYLRLLNDSYIGDHERIKWCPSPNCKYALECQVSPTSFKVIVPTVKCNCGFQFCFGCLRNDHRPAVCSLVKMWLKKCADDSETANWICANTKECPKCQATIEKNGGCNHMTCRKCKHEFCWVCLGPWVDHGTSWYNCGRYEDKAGEDARSSQAKSRALLERYLHYYTRYNNHENSAKLDLEVYKKVENSMQILQKQSEMSWIEVQFLKKAAEILFECRTTLKWTYAFAYYLQRNNHTHIFEDNQRDLEMAVEHLSGLIESQFTPENIPQLKQQIIDKSVYVESRKQILLKDTAKGLLEDRWKYISDEEILQLTSTQQAAAPSKK